MTLKGRATSSTKGRNTERGRVIPLDLIEMTGGGSSCRGSTVVSTCSGRTKVEIDVVGSTVVSLNAGIRASMKAKKGNLGSSSDDRGNIGFKSGESEVGSSPVRYDRAGYLEIEDV